MKSERKPLGALIVAQASPEKSSGDAEADAFDELCSAMGVTPDDHDAARMALTDFVRACIAKSKAGGYKSKAKDDEESGEY